jgi:hypothetical protein
MSWVHFTFTITSLPNFFHPPVTFSLSSPNLVLSTLFSHSPSYSYWRIMASCSLIGGTNGSGRHIAAIVNVSVLRQNKVPSYACYVSQGHTSPSTGYVDTTVLDEGYAVVQLVEALPYKPEGRGFDSP